MRPEQKDNTRTRKRIPSKRMQKQNLYWDEMLDYKQREELLQLIFIIVMSVIASYFAGPPAAIAIAAVFLLVWGINQMVLSLITLGFKYVFNQVTGIIGPSFLVSLEIGLFALLIFAGIWYYWIKVPKDLVKDEFISSNKDR